VMAEASADTPPMTSIASFSASRLLTNVSVCHSPT
jgi:hypothetical protein